MAEISSAEEEELKNALKSGTEVVQALMDIIADAVPDIDKLDVLEYLNTKILKLNDFNFEELRKKIAARGVAGLGVIGNESADKNLKVRVDAMLKHNIRPLIETDCSSYLPAILANGEKEARDKMISEGLAAIATLEDKDLNEGQRALKYKLTETRKSYIFQAVSLTEPDRKVDESTKEKGPIYEVTKETVMWEPSRIEFKDMTKK
jgi:hypothetical protein